MSIADNQTQETVSVRQWQWRRDACGMSCRRFSAQLVLLFLSGIKDETKIPGKNASAFNRGLILRRLTAREQDTGERHTFSLKGGLLGKGQPVLHPRQPEGSHTVTAVPLPGDSQERKRLHPRKKRGEGHKK